MKKNQTNECTNQKVQLYFHGRRIQKLSDFHLTTSFSPSEFEEKSWDILVHWLLDCDISLYCDIVAFETFYMNVIKANHVSEFIIRITSKLMEIRDSQQESLSMILLTPMLTFKQINLDDIYIHYYHP